MDGPHLRVAKVFATSPQSRTAEPAAYLREVADVARWSEDAGCEGILVYTDNGLVDPWLVAQVIMQSTERLCPLVAVQPVYMHPYSAAKMVASLALMHDRRVYLNMLAGGFKNDLEALGDETPHDERYERTVEYSRIMRELMDGRTVALDGRYYRVRNLRLTPEISPELRPGWLISGSSPAGMAAAEAIGATPVKYPNPPGEEAPAAAGREFGIRVGIVAREDAETAWRVAHERFPPDRKGQITHKLAMQVSDSHWHKQLAAREAAEEMSNGSEPEPYWLWPFQNYRTFCPYLVGSYERIAEQLTAYVRLGATTFILDIPPSRDELEHIGVVFNRTQPAVRP